MTFPDTQELLESLQIHDEYDVVRIRQIVRSHAKERGVGLIDQTRLTTATSEILRNMLIYAGGGDVTIESVRVGGREGLLVKCSDEGPGINDLDMAMTDGYSTGNSLGAGLPGSRRLVDGFDIETEQGRGTTVQLLKYL